MRLLPLLLLSCLLFGCSNQPADDRPTPAPVAAAVKQIPKEAPAADPNLNQLSGTLLTPAAGSVVELAILLVDAQGRPRGLLQSRTLSGTGQALPFTLSFTKPSPAIDLRLQLRGRVSVSGRLVQRLPGKFIPAEQNSQLGALTLVSAP